MTATGNPLARRQGSQRISPSRWLDRLSEGRFSLVIATPGLVLVGVFVLLPIAAAITFSAFRIELLRDDFTPFIGFRNYAVRLPADKAFLGTLPLTVWFAFVTSVIAVPLALATALLIHGRARFSGVLAAVLLLPWAVAPIADGILWRLMFEPRTGLATYILDAFGLPPVVIRDAVGTFVAMVVAVTWRAIPLLAILFLSALRLVPTDIRRAATLDGASSLQVFRYVTLPAIAPVVIAGSILQVILALQVFEVQYALSAGNPPQGSMLAGLAIFNKVIGDISLGYGSAMTMVVAMLIALCLAGLYLVVRPRSAPIVPAESAEQPALSSLRPAPGAWVRRERDAIRMSADRPNASTEQRHPGSRRPLRANFLGGRGRRAIGGALIVGVTILLVIGLAGPIYGSPSRASSRRRPSARCRRS